MDNLRWASFKNNFLSDISKLANYEFLEELCLSGNEISRIEKLTELSYLTKLDVSGNRISTVANAEFKSLMYLCLEKNGLRTLRPFAKITTLLELCKCKIVT
jgi:Ran GTPase-activating protein (RanGAP) involved in mRNA processing and transport